MAARGLHGNFKVTFDHGELMATVKPAEQRINGYPKHQSGEGAYNARTQDRQQGELAFTTCYQQVVFTMPPGHRWCQRLPLQMH